jgi:hypothetical protein
MVDPAALVASDRIGLWITVYAVAALVCSIAGARIARRKRYSQLFWLIACFVLPPFLVVLLLLPPRRGGPGRRNDDSEGNGIESFWRTIVSTRR